MSMNNGDFMEDEWCIVVVWADGEGGGGSSTMKFETTKVKVYVLRSTLLVLRLKI